MSHTVRLCEPVDVQDSLERKVLPWSVGVLLPPTALPEPKSRQLKETKKFRGTRYQQARRSEWSGDLSSRSQLAIASVMAQH